jgi:hypothetical protein
MDDVLITLLDRVLDAALKANEVKVKTKKEQKVIVSFSLEDEEQDDDDDDDQGSFVSFRLVLKFYHINVEVYSPRDVWHLFRSIGSKTGETSNGSSSPPSKRKRFNGIEKLSSSSFSSPATCSSPLCLISIIDSLIFSCCDTAGWV